MNSKKWKINLKILLLKFKFYKELNKLLHKRKNNMKKCFNKLKKSKVYMDFLKLKSNLKIYQKKKKVLIVKNKKCLKKYQQLLLKLIKRLNKKKTNYSHKLLKEKN